MGAISRKRGWGLMSFATAAILILSCSQKQQPAAIADSWDKQNVRGINVNDTGYLNAVAAAHEGLSLFITLLNEKKNSKLDFYIKSRVKEKERVEHMWFIVDTFRNASFSAILDNVPDKLEHIKFKDRVEIAEQDVEDWVIYQGDSVLFGNFINQTLK